MTGQARVPQFGEPLTGREVQILRMVEDGVPNAEIGARLFLAEDTIKFTLQRVFRKLGATRRAGAARLARASGQLDLPPEPAAVAAGVSPAALELLLALAEQVAAGRPVPAVRRSAVEALTAAGRRGPGGRPLAAARGRP